MAIITPMRRTNNLQEETCEGISSVIIDSTTIVVGDLIVLGDTYKGLSFSIDTKSMSACLSALEAENFIQNKDYFIIEDKDFIGVTHIIVREKDYDKFKYILFDGLL